MPKKADTLFPELDALGEAEVRKRLAQGTYSYHRPLVEEWLRMKEAERASSAATRAEEREEESVAVARCSLTISEEANRIAHRANRIAVLAAVAAVIALIIQLTQ